MATAINFTTLVAGEALDAPEAVSDTSVYVPENDGLAIVGVTNPTGSTVTISLQPAATIAGLAAAPVTIPIPAGGSVWLRPLPPAIYNDASGNAYVDDPSGELEFIGLRF